LLYERGDDAMREAMGTAVRSSTLTVAVVRRALRASGARRGATARKKRSPVDVAAESKRVRSSSCSEYESHVTPSIPGAAFFFNSKKAARRRSAVT
jgi:hypothetical protein